MYEVIKMDEVISKMMQTTENAGDYIGTDGLLYCGKCHTPKQTYVGFNLAPGDKKETLARVLCRCEKESDDKERRQEMHNRFKLDILQYREDGLSCPNGLRYSFSQDDRQQPKISDACQRYVECWKEMLSNNIGVLFYGSVGTGKSFLASCIGNGLLDLNVPVAATNFPRLLNLLQGTHEKQTLLDRLSVYKLLILDDFGVERDSEYATEQIFNIIDARSSSGLPVIVTTNLTIDEMSTPKSMQYARIYDRVLEMCPIRLKLVGESRRKNNTAKRKKLAQDILLG